MTRSQLLALAAGLGVLSAVLEFAVRADGLARLSPFFLTSYTLATAVRFAGAVLQVCAFGVAVVAFLRPPGTRRTPLLAASAGLFAAWGAATMISQLINLIDGAGFGGDFKWFSMAEVAFAAGALALVLAAGLVFVAVRSTAPRSTLAWACMALAAHFALVAAAYGFDLAGYDSYSSPGGRVTSGLIVGAAGWCIAATAAVKGAIAFSTGGMRRSRELGIAAVVFAVGFAIAAVGLMLYAIQWQSWVVALSELALAGAAAVGAAAFFRPLQQRYGPYLAVPPDPA